MRWNVRCGLRLPVMMYPHHHHHHHHHHHRHRRRHHLDRCQFMLYQHRFVVLVLNRLIWMMRIRVILLYVCISFYFANLYLFFCISLCESPCCILFLYLITLLLIFPAFFQPSGVLLLPKACRPCNQRRLRSFLRRLRLHLFVLLWFRVRLRLLAFRYRLHLLLFMIRKRLIWYTVLSLFLCCVYPVLMYFGCAVHVSAVL
jgi:hypothetical protein